MDFGSTAHLNSYIFKQQSAVTAASLPLEDIFGGIASVRQPNFYSDIYERALIMTGRLGIDPSATSAEEKIKFGFSDTYDLSTYGISKELRQFNLMKTWLFDNTLNDKLVAYILFTVIPYFMFNIYEQLRYHESKSESNIFEYTYSSVVFGNMANSLTSATGFDAIKFAQAKWVMMYVIKTLVSEMSAAATDFIGKLGLESPNVQVSKSITISTFLDSVSKLKIKIRKLLFEVLEPGTGVRVYEHVRPYLNEICVSRQATAEPGRIELIIDSAASAGEKFKVVTKDRSLKYIHTKSIADSHLFQAYVIGEDNILEPLLSVGEISDFVASNVAFSSGEINTSAFHMNDFVVKALDSSKYIDVNRISSMINENGFNIPHAVEGLSIIYPNNTKDLWFSANPYSSFSGNASSIEVEQQIRLQHMFNGLAITLAEDSFKFGSAVTSELGMIICQRIFAMMIPETSPTGSAVTTYNNVHGTALIDGTMTGSYGWIGDTIIKGADTTVYNGLYPILDFFTKCRIDNVPCDNTKNILIGTDLLKQFYNILKTYGFLELIGVMQTTWRAKVTDSPENFPTDSRLLGGWTGIYGEKVKMVPLQGYGNKFKEVQCVKHILATVSSSVMLEVFARAISQFLTLEMASVPSDSILQLFEKAPVAGE